MAEITVTKTINPAQLGVELGRIPLRAIGPDEDGQTRVRGDVTVSALRSAVEAHTADPAWTDPNPTPPTAEQVEATETQTQLSAIRDKARQVWAGEGTFTAAQVQKILAGLVLRATR